MAQRATSLGPKPSLFLLFCFCFFVLCFVFFVCFGGFKGQVRWPKGPPHLALNSPYLFFLFFCFVLCFVFFGCLIQNQKPCFPPEKGFFIYFQCFSFFLPLPFWASLFFCFSFSVSLFSSFLSFFLLVFVLAFFWFLVFVSFFSFFLSLSSLLFFHERNNIKIFNCKFFWPAILSLF